MAVSVAYYSGDLLVRDSRRQGIPVLKTGTDDRRYRHGLRSRIKALVGFWEELKDYSAPRGRVSCSKVVWDARSGATRDLFQPYGSVNTDAVPPPTYDESVQDSPPDYTATDALATVQIDRDLTVIGKGNVFYNEKPKACQVDLPELDAKVDLSEIEGIRSHPNKKAKKAAKEAQISKWADSDNEEKNEGGADGGAGGDDNGGGDGDAGAGGDGGDAPGGGGDGGGDDDWWNTGGSKKKDKKKKKKNAWEEFEDEEKKREEEEAKKAEEEAAAKGDAAAEADPIDDWGSFATAGKKKKGKKGADPLPPPPPDPESKGIDLGASATADANPDDDFGGFSTGKKKKGKKGKVRVLSFRFTTAGCMRQRSLATLVVNVARDC